MQSKESDIRKKEAFDQYLDLVKKDIKKFFDFDSFQLIDCPACNNNQLKISLIKEGFTYVTCDNCGTLFSDPRPTDGMLQKFYRESESTDYWVNQFFKPVSELRRRKIFKPRAEFVSRTLVNKSDIFIGDIGAGFGLFIEELRKLRPDCRYLSIEPSIQMAQICRARKIDTLPDFVENITSMDEEFDVLTAFELLEHLLNPHSFLAKVHSLLKPDGHLYLTTLNGKGFDIQMLGSKSKSISPPHHLNFFNLESITSLLENHNFDVEQISTPGKLDWDIVEGMIKNNEVYVNNFWNILAKEKDDKTKIQFQRWLSNNNMSSHMSVIAKKR